MANKLNNSQSNSKLYWSPLKCFLKNKRVSLIPPLFHENKFVSNFLEKAELLIHFFQNSVQNRSTLLTHVQYLTNNRLSSETFFQDGTAKMIQNLDYGKTVGHYKISIHMLKICRSLNR